MEPHLSPQWANVVLDVLPLFVLLLSTLRTPLEPAWWWCGVGPSDLLVVAGRYVILLVVKKRKAIMFS